MTRLFINKLVLILLIVSLILSTINLPRTNAATAAADDSTAQNYIIKYKDIEKGKKDLITVQKKKRNNRSLKKLSKNLIAVLTDSEFQIIKNDKNVVYVEKDAKVKIAADTITSNLTQIHATQVHDLGVTGTGVNVAVLDTGISLQSNEIHVTGGVSFVPNESTYSDLNGHGTFVAGIIGALKDGEGLVGVAPDSNLFAVKVLDQSGSGSISQVIQGIEWAMDNHIDIVNMSFAGTATSQALQDAVSAASDLGMVIVAAAGNDSATTISSPANLTGVVAVGAVNSSNQLAAFSNKGTQLQFVAPGVNIQGLSLTPGTYVTQNGTSAASAQVAGTAALLKSKSSALSGAQIIQAMQESAVTLGDHNSFGYGIIHASDALIKVEGLIGTGGTNPHGTIGGTPASIVPKVAQGLPFSGNFIGTIDELASLFDVTSGWVQQQLDSGATLTKVYSALLRSSITGESYTSVVQSFETIPFNNSENIEGTVTNDVYQTDLIRDIPLSTGDFHIASLTDFTLDNAALSNINTKVYGAPIQIGTNSESVSTLNGGLSTKKTDLTLPGRGGLSFALTRSYDSNSSQFYDMDVSSSTSSYSNSVTKYGFNYSYDQYIGNSIAYQVVSHLYCYTHSWSSINLSVIGDVSYCSSTTNLGTYSDLQQANAAVAGLASSWTGPVQSRGFINYTQNQVTWGSLNIIPVSVYKNYIGGSAASYSSEQEAKSAGQQVVNQLGGGNVTTFSQTFNTSGTTTSYANQTVKAYDESKFPIGKGWNWDLSSVQTKEGKQYVHLSGNGVYEITGNTLKGYPWQDLSFSADTSITEGSEQSSYVLKNIVSGLAQYFNSQGQIIKIRDAYNNTVSFAYTQHALYGKVLGKVTDAIGNTINITYSSTQVILQSGSKTVTYNKTNDSGMELLSNVSDAGNRKTSYDYTIKAAKFNLLNGGQMEINNPYALLTGVTYPTGAKSVINYDPAPVKRFLGSSGYNQAYRVISREEQYKLTNGTSTNTMTANHQDVYYTNDVQGSYGADQTFAVSINDGLSQTTYNSKKHFIDDNTPSVYYTTNVTQVAGTLTKKTDQTYEENRRLPVPSSTSTILLKNTNGVVTQSSPVIESKTYDNYGNILTSTDPMGNQITANTYDPTTHWLMSTAQKISSTQTQYTEIQYYQPQGSLKQMVVKENNTQGNIVSQKNFLYDIYGNPTTITIKDDNNRNDIVTRSYSAVYSGAYLTQQSINVKDIEGTTSSLTQRLEYELATGLIKQSTDGNGNITSYLYDSLDRPKVVTNPDGSTVTMTYDDTGNQVARKDETGTITYSKYNPLGLKSEEGVKDQLKFIAKSKFGYDNYGRMIWNEDALGNREQLSYDAMSRLLGTTHADGSISITSYDDINRTKIVTDEVSNRSQEKYDVLGRVIEQDQLGTVSTPITPKPLINLSYDYSGNVTESKDAKGFVTTNEYDVLNRLVSVKNPLQEKTQYKYSLASMLIQTIHPDNSTVVNQYDEIGRKIKEVDELQQEVKYYYDANNNVSKKIDHKQQVFTYVYDNRNLLRHQVLPGETISFNYDSAGRKMNMIDGTGQTNYLYDSITGLMIKQTFPDLRTIEYQYDAQGNRSSMKDPFGYTNVYHNDRRNRLDGVGPALNNWDATYKYEDNGALETIQKRNGVISTYSYDDRVRLTDLIQKKGSAAPVNSFHYDYDLNSNMSGKSENGSSLSFTNDKLNRIETTTANNEVYSYDKKGNRQTMQSTALPDAMLNEYSYDSANRLTKVSTKDGKTVNYKYNGDGHLYERVLDGVTTRYYYDGENLIAEANVINNVVALTAHYIRGVALVARMDSNGIKAYYETNGHGDVVNLLDGTGGVLNQYSYDIWGNPLIATETVANPFRYSGEYWDNQTKLQYLRARWYDPSMGRFINQDTYEGDIKNPLSLNRYAYVTNNPLIKTDPTGHDAIIITAKDAAQGFGHTSVLYQNSSGDWYYTYWGDKTVIVKEIDSNAMSSLANFNAWNDDRSLYPCDPVNGQPYSGNTHGYTSSTYIAGDFTKSLNFFNKLEEQYIKNDSFKGDGSSGDGKTTGYRLLWNNCLAVQLEALRLGVTSDGTKVSAFLHLIHDTIPNHAAPDFEKALYNNAFTLWEYNNQLDIKTDYYQSKSVWVRWFYSFHVDEMDSLRK